MNTLEISLKDTKPKANHRETFRLAMEIIRTTIPMAILTIQILIYFQ
jgi:hypothetical protein